MREAPTREQIYALDDAALHRWWVWLESDAWARKKGYEPESTSDNPARDSGRVLIEMGQRLLRFQIVGDVASLSQTQIARTFRRELLN